MPRTTDELLGLFRLEQLDTDLFRGPQPETSLQRSFLQSKARRGLMSARSRQSSHISSAWSRMN